MRAILFLIGSVVLANIVWATFFWKTPASATGKPEPVVNSATVQGQEPWMVNEKYNAPGRGIARKSALEALDKPWSSFCNAEGRKLLIDAVNYYYGQRNAQIQSYERTYGDAAKRYAIKAWTTTDDNRIERKMRETYGRGYFSLNDLRPVTRTALAEVVKGERVTGKPCAG
jgi:hypothetical protein